MSNEIEINVNDLHDYIRRKWLILLLVPLLAAIISFSFFNFLAVPEYESSSMICITSGNGTVVQNMLSELQAGTALTSDYKTLATSKPVLEQVIEELDLDCTYEDLEEVVSTENPENTRILTITVRDQNPQNAKIIVNKLTSIVVDKIADIMNTSKPNILQWGDVPKEKVWPSPIKYGILTGVGAFILTLICLVLLYLQNDTINSTDDVERILNIKTLALIPKEATNDRSQH